MPNFTKSRGDLQSPIAVIGYKPTPEDEAKGVVFMDTSGWFIDKLFADASLPVPAFHTIQPLESSQLPDAICEQALIETLELTKPPFIVTVDSRKIKGETIVSDVLMALCPDTKGQLSKYVGSLLISPRITWPHYVLPIFSPSIIFAAYEERDICLSIDLGKLREELKWRNANDGKVQPLPQRELIVEPNFAELMDYLQVFHLPNARASVDIETIRPPKDSKTISKEFKKHPGYPYTLSLAPSRHSGISFSYWDYNIDQLLILWKEIDWILQNVPQIGQNYFLFDIIFQEALGFSPNLAICKDTRIRHHILWPELPHSLQFQTRQYTRQPYYKDEGKNWRPKDKKRLMIYNALDTTVTFEVEEEQEKEFAERPWLL